MPVLWFLALIMNSILLFKIYNRLKKNDGYCYPLLGLSIALFGWVFSELLLKLVMTKAIVLFIHEFKYVFILAAPEFLLNFVKAYTGKTIKITKVQTFRIGLEFFFMIMIVTNPQHHLFRNSIQFESGMVNTVITDNNIGYYLITLFIYCIVLYSVLLLLKYNFSLAAVYRRRVFLILTGIIIALFTNFIFQYVQYFFKTDDHIDFTSLTFGLIAWLIYYALFVYKDRKLSNFVENFITNKIEHGVLFLNTDYEIHYINTTMINMLGTKQDAILFTKITDVSEKLILTIQKALESGQPVLSRIVRDQIYVYEVSVQEIFDKKNKTLGKLVEFKDVTDIQTEKVQTLNLDRLSHLKA